MIDNDDLDLSEVFERPRRKKANRGPVRPIMSDEDREIYRTQVLRDERGKLGEE